MTAMANNTTDQLAEMRQSYRKMDDETMLQISEASADARQRLAAKMAPLYQGRPAEWLAAATRAGSRKLFEVRRGSVVIAVFWAWVSKCNATFVVNACGSLVPFDIHIDLFQAIEEAAARMGCAAVQFQTARRGLVEKAKNLGYIPEGIVLSKRL
jgi:hypothetical protein